MDNLRISAAAAVLGTAAYQAGKACVPGADKAMLDLIGAYSRKLGDCSPWLSAWSAAWHQANLAAPIGERVTFRP